MADWTRRLDSSLIQGIAWTGAIRWLAQLLSWAATLMIARLLTPADYGVVGMALVYLGFAQIINENGLSAALIQERDLTEDQIGHIAGLVVLLGVAMGALTLGLANLVAWFFDEPRVRAIVTALSLTFVARSAQVTPRALLARNLEFRKVAWIDGFEALTLTTSTLFLALAGAGYWALVGGTIACSFATAALCLRLRPHPLALPRDLGPIAHAVAFSGHVIGAQVAWYVYSNADFAVVGRLLGTTALGAYAFAWTIASIPVERVSGLVGRVTPAFFAAVQHEPVALRRYVRNLTEGLAFVTLPACIGLGLLADEFVLLVLGDTWRAAVTPLRLLCIYAAIRSVVTLTPQVLFATGQSKRSMQFSVLAALVLPAVFLFGSRWGTTGVALGWVLVYPALVVALFVRSTLRTIGMPWKEYGRALWPAASATLVMAAVVLALRAAIPSTVPLSVRFATQALAGACTYLAVVFAAHGVRLRGLFALLRNGRYGRPTPTYATAPAAGDARLLLISYHFPPDPGVGGLRWQKFVRHGAERGWGCDVISLDPAALSGRDQGRAADLPAGVRVYGVPLPRLRIEGFEEAVWGACRKSCAWVARATAIGCPQPVGERPTSWSIGRQELRYLPSRPRDLLRAYWAWLEYARTGRWALQAAKTALDIYEPGTHRAVIASGPPHMAHVAGRMVARATGLPFIMDMRDPWSLAQRLPEAIASPVWFRLAARRERQAVAQASLVVTCSTPLRDAMRKEYREAANRTIAVLNGCDGEPAPPSRHGRRFIVAYAGSIYLDRDPRSLFRAAARLIADQRLEPADFGIDLMGRVGWYDGLRVETIAAEEGVGEFVRTFPTAPRAEALRFLARAAMLVILPQDSDLAIPAKVFDYMEFNAWLLALAERGSATELLLRDSGADVVSPQDIEGIAAALWRRYTMFRGRWRPPRLADDERYSRRTQARALFDAIERRIGSVGGWEPAPRRAASMPGVAR